MPPERPPEEAAKVASRPRSNSLGVTKIIAAFYALALALIWWSARGKPDARTPAFIMSLGLGAAALSVFAIFFVGKGAMFVGAAGLVAFIAAYAVSLKRRAPAPRTPPKGNR